VVCWLGWTCLRRTRSDSEGEGTQARWSVIWCSCDMLMDCSKNVIFPNSPTDDYSKPLPIPQRVPSSILPMSTPEATRKACEALYRAMGELDTFEDRSDLASPTTRGAFEDCYENVGWIGRRQRSYQAPYTYATVGISYKRGQEYRGRWRIRWVVMPRFGPEPKFEPEPGRTEPRSGLKVQVSGRTGPMVRFEVQRMAVFCRADLNPSELNFIKVPKN